jgi:hypothetical protein
VTGDLPAGCGTNDKAGGAEAAGRRVAHPVPVGHLVALPLARMRVAASRALRRPRMSETSVSYDLVAFRNGGSSPVCPYWVNTSSSGRSGKTTPSSMSGPWDRAGDLMLRLTNRRARFVRERIRRHRHGPAPAVSKSPGQALFARIGPGHENPLDHPCKRQVVGSTPTSGSANSSRGLFLGRAAKLSRPKDPAAGIAAAARNIAGARLWDSGAPTRNAPGPERNPQCHSPAKDGAAAPAAATD